MATRRKEGIAPPEAAPEDGAAPEGETTGNAGEGAAPSAPAGLAGRMDETPPPARGEAGEDIDEEQFDLLVEVITESIFGGDTPDGELSTPIRQLLLANAEAPHGAPEAVAETAAYVMNAAVGTADEQGIVLEPNVILFGTLVTLDKLVTVAEGEAGEPMPDDEVAQAFTAGMEKMYEVLGPQGIFSERDARAAIEDMKNHPEEVDANLREYASPEAVDAMLKAVGSAAQTAQPQAVAPPEPEAMPPGGGGVAPTGAPAP